MEFHDNFNCTRQNSWAIFLHQHSQHTLSILSRYRFNLKIEAEGAANTALMNFSGYIFLLLGIIVVVIHNVWSRDWRVVVTILGWMLLLKGFMRIIVPEKVQMAIHRKKESRVFWLAEVISFLVGFFLVYKGFIHN